MSRRPPNYRDPDMCLSCMFNDGDFCKLYDYEISESMVCDDYRVYEEEGSVCDA